MGRQNERGYSKPSGLGDDGYGQFRIPSEQPSAVASQPPGQQGLAGLWRSTLEQEIPYCVGRMESLKSVVT